MRPAVAFVILTVGLGGVARAQTPAARPMHGYAEGVAQSAFGNVTSQSFGGEIGIGVTTSLEVFVDVGHVRDAAPAGLGAGAQRVAGFLAENQSGVTFRAKEPVTFGAAGLRYAISTSGALQPYVLGGMGVARANKDVGFALNGSDVTSTIQQHGIALGSDLSGSETKAMLAMGGGLMWPAWQRLIVDLQYRYGRVLTDGRGLNINRVGVGVRF